MESIQYNFPNWVTFQSKQPISMINFGLCLSYIVGYWIIQKNHLIAAYPLNRLKWHEKIVYFMSYSSTSDNTYQCAVSRSIGWSDRHNRLNKIINDKGIKTRVIRFWATWCKPCVEELQILDQINVSRKADVVIISLDFIEDLDTKVYSFITQHEITSRICLLNNVDCNSWINVVDYFWTGAIPATPVINPGSGESKFVEKKYKMVSMKSC